MSNNIDNCIWCGSKNLNKFTQPISKYKTTLFFFNYCNNCEIKFAYSSNNKHKINYDKIQNEHFGYKRHVADNKWVKSIFNNKNQNFCINEISNFLISNTMDQRYVQAVKIANLAYAKKKQLKILEIGCNLGYVGALFIKQKHNYIGIDIQKNAIKEARKNYGNFFYNIAFEDLYKKIKNQKFDLICSFEVIEHLKNPLEFIQIIIKNLKTNGEAILSTPNGNYINKNTWHSELPPIHFSLFKEKTFKILKKNNLKLNFYNKHQFSFNLSFIKFLLRKNSTQHIPITDPENGDFIYSYKKIKHLIIKNFHIIRLTSLINLFFSLILSFFNLAPLGGQIFIGIRKSIINKNVK
jgi:2-polyprenyl-3-methyl-5-hydroxy-6-metoxy-1,4-benzoquinol methylase